MLDLRREKKTGENGVLVAQPSGFAGREAAPVPVMVIAELLAVELLAAGLLAAFALASFAAIWASV
jgi:hypothetical protein